MHFFILIHKSHYTTYLPDRRNLIRIPKLIRNRNKHLFIFILENISSERLSISHDVLMYVQTRYLYCKYETRTTLKRLTFEKTNFGQHKVKE